MKIHHVDDYRKRRKAEYPSTGEQLDAVMKLADALQEQGVSLPEETRQWIENCKEVKAKYRKV